MVIQNGKGKRQKAEGQKRKKGGPKLPTEQFEAKQTVVLKLRRKSKNKKENNIGTYKAQEGKGRSGRYESEKSLERAKIAAIEQEDTSYSILCLAIRRVASSFLRVAKELSRFRLIGAFLGVCFPAGNNRGSAGG